MMNKGGTYFRSTEYSNVSGFLYDVFFSRVCQLGVKVFLLAKMGDFLLTSGDL